ncbi:MAG: 2-dehydropantoate 2-reductase [Alphaproteobacteria bacterium]|nr:2-dehydropantoate 2-reductase [Alphaproteobacteria bacterium]
MPDSTFRVAVMGAGAVGGYYGARLAAAGTDVTFIARGLHLDAIRKQGLRVLSPFGDMTIDSAKSTDDPGEVGPVDIVLLMVKLYDVASAAEQISPMLKAGTGVVALQNGVEAPNILADVIGREHVMGGSIYIPAKIGEPGVIIHGGGFARAIFGELDGSRSDRAQALLNAFQNAGVDAEITEDVESTLWTKFVVLSAVSATTAVTRGPIGPVMKDPDMRAMFIAAMRETEAVGRVKGVRLDEDIFDTQLTQAEDFPPEVKSSLLQDLEAGKRLEVEFLSGTVSRLGAELGVPTPVHSTIYAALKPFVYG